jgi:hypothetical protein
MANSLNPTNSTQSDAIAAVTSSLQSATLFAPGGSGSSSASTSFSASSLSSASSSSHGSLAAIKKAHDDKVKSQTGDEVRSLTEEETQTAVSLASPTLTTPMSLEDRAKMLEIKGALESAKSKVGKNHDPRILIHAFVDIEFEKSWEIGILNKYNEACEMITSIKVRIAERSFDDRVFEAAERQKLEPYKLKFLYEELQKTSTASSFPPSPIKHRPSNSHSSSAVAAPTSAKSSDADAAMAAAVKELRGLMDTDYKGDVQKLAHEDFLAIAQKHGVNIYTLIHAVGF